jgi:hypothetical protein
MTGLAGLCVTAAASASSAQPWSEIAPAQVSCGAPGLPACPLQAWMRTNLAAPLAASDAAAVAMSLENVARMSPEPDWTTWETFASEGARAARKGDVAAARASCRGCHDAFREAYKQKHRSRPVRR